MANKLRSRRIDTTTEKRVLTGMIVSKHFLEQVMPILNFDYFQNSYIRKVTKWVATFFENYEDAPFDHIQDIYDSRKDELDPEEAGLISKLLLDISEKYTNGGGINDAYLLDLTTEFFRKRELEITQNNLQILLEKNDLKSAEAQITNFSKVALLTSDWVNPFEEKYVERLFEEEHRLFQFHGELGRFIGGIDRDWLVGVVGSFKSGKTWMLQEFAVAAMQQRLRVAFFSLEMTVKASTERLYRRFGGFGGEYNRPVTIPCFDCVANQDGSCARAERTNKYPLFTGDAEKPEFDPNIKYRVCTYCREVPELRRHYLPGLWYLSITPPKYSYQSVAKRVAKLQKLYGPYYRFKRYPRFSATIDDILRDLALLEKAEDFFADMIIVDYADIIKNDSQGNSNDPKNIDEIWKRLAGLAGEKRAIVVTASQVNREALDKRSIHQKNLSLWIGKLAHVDAMFSLNQQGDEKKKGILRVEKLVHRHDNFTEDESCVVLQHIGAGQVHLDSQIM